MPKYPQRIYVRASEDGIARARRLSEATGLSFSQLVRVLLQMSADTIDPEFPRAVALDFTDAHRLYREMRHWATSETRLCMP